MDFRQPVPDQLGPGPSPGSQALKYSEPDPEPYLGPTLGRARVGLKSPGLGSGSGLSPDPAHHYLKFLVLF